MVPIRDDAGSVSRHLVLVTGPPAAGKSTVAGALSDALDLPCFSKDAIKETLFEALGVGDVDWSKRLGHAAMEILLSVVAEIPAAIVDCNFDPSWADRFVSPDVVVVEVFCRVSSEIATQRFAERVRHEGHRDDERFHEIASWIDSAAPLGIGALLELDTSGTPDVPGVATWVRNALH
jgi:chloramphenicol 3-O-phosphotransferase